MKRLVQRRSGTRDGFLLVTAAALIFIAAMAAVVVTTAASTSNDRAELAKAQARARYLAQGALARVEQDIREQVFNSYSSGGQAVYLLESIGAVQGLLERDGTVTVGDTPVTYSVRDAGVSTLGRTDDGLQAVFLPIEIVATVSLPGIEHQAHRLMRASFVPAYQFAVFFDMDFELWPGPAMTISGPVHSNGDMWLGAGNSLTFDTNYVRCTGDLYQNRPHKEDENKKPLRFRKWVEDPFDPAEPAEFDELLTEEDLDDMGLTSDSGMDSLFLGYDDDGDGLFYGSDDLASFQTWPLEAFDPPDLYGGDTGYTLMTGEHGTTHITMPELASTSMFVETEPGVGDYTYDETLQTYVATAAGTGTHRKGPFHDAADLSILVAADGTWQAFDGLGAEVTADLAGAVTIGSVADVRESEDVHTTEIDMAALGASGHFPSNGMLYLGAMGDTPLDGDRGFLLKNASTLPAALTTVTENFLYIQGDYNTVDKKPASVICDVINLLSNAWDGSKTLTSGKPSASETTYNVAIVAGNRESVAGKRFAGGFENFTRFHETWSGVYCNITGSFVSLGEPVYSYTTLNGAAYSPPKRRWDYDTDFNDLANMPPYTPCFLDFLGVVDW